MYTMHPLRLLIFGIFALVNSMPAFAEKKYDVGATDTKIKIGQTMPYSGPASSYSAIAKAEAAYFKAINEQGGINGRKIELISYDDGYSPPKTVEQVRKLVESDEVLLTFQIFGTSPNAAVQKYLNLKKVPQLLAISGATRSTDPGNYPWTMAFNPTYRSEALIYAKYILENHPRSKIAVLYQSGDLGRDYLDGLKEGLGERSSMIIAEASYDVTDPTIDSQVVRLKASGADLLYDITTARSAAQVIKKLSEINWKPTHLISINSTSVDDVLKPAGLSASQGIISSAYMKEPADPQWKDDAGMKAFYVFLENHYPDGKSSLKFSAYAYSASQLLVKILRQCGDNLTRENVMKQAANLKDVSLDLYLPGMFINTSEKDYRLTKQFQMMRFTDERWERFGPIFTQEEK